MHGGNNPGAPKGTANGNYKHGRDTKEAKASDAFEAANIRYLVRLAAPFLKEDKRVARMENIKRHEFFGNL